MEEYMKNDRLSVTVRADKAELITNAYGVFGWELESEKSDKKSDSVVHMDFIRDHYINGKDRLQYLQVKFDIALNAISKTKRKTPARAAVFGVIFELFGLAFIIAGVIMVAFLRSSIQVGYGITLIVASSVCIVFAWMCATKIYKEDRQKHGAVIKVLEENLKNILSEASEITGCSYADR